MPDKPPERIWMHTGDDDCWCAYHFEEDGAHDKTLVAFVPADSLASQVAAEKAHTSDHIRTQAQRAAVRIADEFYFIDADTLANHKGDKGPIRAEIAAIIESEFLPSEPEKKETTAALPFP